MLANVYVISLFAENKTVMYSDPFTCCVLPNFIKDEHFLEGLKDELLDQIFIEKNNDLYKFQQVKFHNSTFPNIDGCKISKTLNFS